MATNTEVRLVLVVWSQADRNLVPTAPKGALQESSNLLPAPTIVLEDSDELGAAAFAALSQVRKVFITDPTEPEFRAAATKFVTDVLTSKVGEYGLTLDAGILDHCCQNGKCERCGGGGKGILFPLMYTATSTFVPVRVSGTSPDGNSGADLDFMICVTRFPSEHAP